MTQPYRSLVTIGAGQAAVSTVRLLRRRGFEGRITMLSAEPHVPYQRPPLSKDFLLGDADADDLTILDDRWCAQNDVDLRLGTAAASVAPGRVSLVDGGEVSADAVLVASGARARVLPGVTGDRVVHLRTLDDAVRLRALLLAARRVVVVGGGLIGSEVASTARALGVDVITLEAAELPLVNALGSEMARVYADIHREHGVDLRCGRRITSVDEVADGVRVSTAGERLEGDLLVVAVGAVPGSEVARSSGLALDPWGGGVLVDDTCRTGMDGVFAAGDVATRAEGDELLRAEHVDNATAQGRVVAAALLGTARPADEAPWYWSDQFDLGLQVVGRPRPDARVVVRGSVAERDFTAFYLLEDGRVHAAFTVERGEDVPAARALIAQACPVDPAVLTDEDHDLFDLLDPTTA